MGVDLSISSVVGVVLDLEGIKALPDYEDYGLEETLEIVFADRGASRKGLTFGVAGNYWTGRPESQPWIGLQRLTESFDMHDLPGGIIDSDSLGAPDITEEEGKRLRKLAKKLGTKKPEIKQFMSVLWH